MAMVWRREALPMSTVRPQAAVAKMRLALWVRLTAAIALALLATWSLMIYLTYEQRREAAIAQAQQYSQSVNQMTMAALTSLMLTKVIDQRATFLDQIRTSSEVQGLKVFRTGSVLDQYGEGEGGESRVTAEERSVMQSGRPYLQLVEGEQSLRAIYPVLNSPISKPSSSPPKKISCGRPTSSPIPKSVSKHSPPPSTSTR